MGNPSNRIKASGIILLLLITTFSTAKTCAEKEKIALITSQPLHPVYYSYNGYLSVFNALHLVNSDELAPLLNKYDMLTYMKDSVWVESLIFEETEDTLVSQFIEVKIKSQMFELYRTGNVRVINPKGKLVRTIYFARHDKAKISSGVNQLSYFSEGKKSPPIFEWTSAVGTTPGF